MKPKDYVGYVTGQGNGLKKTVLVDGWEFSMQYRPYDYIMLMESKGDWSNYDRAKRERELKGTAWFSISIKRADNTITPLRYGIRTINEYNIRLNYYLNEAKKDIRLMYGNDTLETVSYLFENNYNLTPQETMIAGFYLPKGDNVPEKNMQLSFTDRVFQSGIIKAEYSEKTLYAIPNLIY